MIKLLSLLKNVIISLFVVTSLVAAQSELNNETNESIVGSVSYPVHEYTQVPTYRSNFTTIVIPTVSQEEVSWVLKNNSTSFRKSIEAQKAFAKPILEKTENKSALNTTTKTPRENVTVIKYAPSKPTTKQLSDSPVPLQSLMENNSLTQQGVINLSNRLENLTKDIDTSPKEKSRKPNDSMISRILTWFTW